MLRKACVVFCRGLALACKPFAHGNAQEPTLWGSVRSGLLELRFCSKHHLLLASLLPNLDLPQGSPDFGEDRACS